MGEGTHPCACSQNTCEQWGTDCILYGHTKDNSKTLAQELLHNGLCSYSQDSWCAFHFFLCVCTGPFWSYTSSSIRKLFSEDTVRDGRGWELWPFKLKWVIYFSGDLKWLTLISISPGNCTSSTKGHPQPLLPPGARVIKFTWYMYLIMGKRRIRTEP